MKRSHKHCKENSLTSVLPVEFVRELEIYDYTIEHRSGTKMQHVDALSRIPDPISVASVQNNEIEFQLFATQTRDRRISELKDRLENEPADPFVLSNSVVYRQNSTGALCLYVPSETEQNIIRHIHEKIAHQGINKTYEKIRKKLLVS